MTTLRSVNSDEVRTAVVEAARAACERLDETFPGVERNGITSNFHGLLEEALMHMLKGRSLLDAQRGHYTKLPVLVIDDGFFGNPHLRGDAFLITREGRPVWDDDGSAPHLRDGEVLALEPDGAVFKPISKVGDAWTSFEAAAAAAMKYCGEEGLNLEGAMALKLNIQPVVPRSDSDCGYVLDERRSWAMDAAARERQAVDDSPSP
jgi:hypothetical protein